MQYSYMNLPSFSFSNASSLFHILFITLRILVSIQQRAAIPYLYPQYFPQHTIIPTLSLSLPLSSSYNAPLLGLGSSVFVFLATCILVYFVGARHRYALSPGKCYRTHS